MKCTKSMISLEQSSNQNSQFSLPQPFKVLLHCESIFPLKSVLTILLVLKTHLNNTTVKLKPLKTFLHLKITSMIPISVVMMTSQLVVPIFPLILTSYLQTSFIYCPAIYKCPITLYCNKTLQLNFIQNSASCVLNLRVK